MKNNRPVAVIISDVHYSLGTLKEADASMRMAIAAAAELRVPLIDAGDLTNDKAILRAEVANALLSTMKMARDREVEVYLLVGNHSLINEKGQEHALNFLKPYAYVVDKPKYVEHLATYFLPYMSDTTTLRAELKKIPEKSTIIMHQGVQGADMGHYVQDKTSLSPEEFANYRVISGHYHKAQDIKCGRPRHGAVGLFSYVGNPYTLTFGEASDGLKGFKILNENGLLDHVGTNLRKHVIITFNMNNGDITKTSDPLPGDRIWVKVTGKESDIRATKKAEYARVLEIGHTDFKLDLIPDTADDVMAEINSTKSLTDAELLDKLISEMQETEAQKVNLKAAWRDLLK